MTADVIDWPGSFGTKHRFWFVELSLAGLYRQPGVYIFVRRANPGWLPVYIGIADDLVDRLTGHDRWAEAQQLGATHLMAQVQIDRTAREKAEQDLIGYWNPPLNTHHRTDRKAG
jgi:hypothetical protein